MSELVGNLEYRFSHDAATIIPSAFRLYCHQAEKRKFMRHTIAKLTAHPNSRCFAILAVFCIIGSFAQYYYWPIDSTLYSNKFPFQDHHAYFVNSYKLNVSNGILEMKGYYLTGNNTHRASLDVNGLDVLLNHIRPKSINDPKLEKAQLPYQAFFLQQAVGTARGWF